MKNKKLFIVSVVILVLCSLLQVCSASSSAPKVANSVVRIVTDTASGTGFFINDQMIVTNHHCITPYWSSGVIGDENWNIKAINTIVAVSYSVMGGDAEYGTVIQDWPEVDLAVIQLSTPTDKREPVRFYDTNKELVAGEHVWVFGFPGVSGTTQDTVTTYDGTISTIQTDQYSADSTVTKIQTSATINPGNSGGPLTDDKGRVVGICNSASSVADAAFAIHFKELTKRLDQEGIKYNTGSSLDPKMLVLGVAAVAVAAAAVVLLKGKKPAQNNDVNIGVPPTRTEVNPPVYQGSGAYVEGISGELTGKRQSLQMNDVTFGRDGSCTVRFTHTSVSSKHCVIHYSRSNSCYTVMDQKSTNGTYLVRNGETSRVPSDKAFKLHNGDVIRLANEDSFKVCL